MVIPAFTTNAMTSDFLSPVSPDWVVMFLDSHRMVFVFRSWFDLLGVVLAFFGSPYLKSLNHFQTTDTRLQATKNIRKVLQVILWAFIRIWRNIVSRKCFGISHLVFYGDHVYNVRRVKCEANCVSSGSKILKRIRRRKYDPVITARIIDLMLSPSTALYRSYRKHCTGWFSDNFNFCCIICLYFGISNFKIYPVYISSSKYCGWLKFRWVPIFVVFVEGPNHEFQYPRNGNFLYELWKKILWPRILNPTNVSFLFNPRKLVPTKIKPSTVYISWFEYQQRTIWNINFILTTFLCNSENKMSSPSHTWICLQKINWLSYLHTNTAKMLQKWQYKSHQKKKNSTHRLYWNIKHSFQNFPKKWRVRQFFHCDTNA